MVIHRNIEWERDPKSNWDNPDWRMPVSRRGQALPVYNPWFEYLKSLTKPMEPLEPSEPSEPPTERKKKQTFVNLRRLPNKNAKLELNDTEIDKAVLVKAHDIAVKEGLEKAQKYIDDNTVLYYKIDPENVNKEIMIVKDVLDNNIGVLRGTDIKAFEQLVQGNVGDIELTTLHRDTNTNLDIISGEGRNNVGYRNAREILNRAHPTELIGYSKGGGLAILLGNEMGIPTTTFNPLIGKKALRESFIDSTHKHTVYRTDGDFASFALSTKDYVPLIWKNYDINVLQPTKKGYVGLDHDYHVHRLDNFTSQEERMTSGELEHQKLIMDYHEKNKALNAFEARKAYNDFMSEAGPSTRSFKDFVNHYNGGRQRAGFWATGTPYDGHLHREWVHRGNEITMEERDALLDQAGIDLDMADFNPPDPFPEDVTREQLHEQRQKALEAKDSFEPPLQQAFAKKAFQDHLNEHLSPTGIASGLVAGYLGDKAMEQLDPNQKLGIEGDITASGAIGGGILAATGAGLEAIPTFAVGSLAGYEAQKGITSGLEKVGASQDTAEALGYTGAGASAGAAAVGTGAAIAGTSAFLAGESAIGAASAALAPETLGLSVVVGGVLGAGMWGLHKLKLF